VNSVRENILKALETNLASVQNATVYRSRQTALARSEGSAILLEPENEQVEKRASNPGGLVLRNFLVDLSVLARGDPADGIADPIITAAHVSIMADPTLGNLCSQIIEHSTEWKFEEADLTAVEVLIRYQIRYATTTNDLTRSI
jgi:hypothetical protein